METRLIPDEQPVIERTLIELVDTVGCHLVLTTGGTGPAPRDVTPEATLAVAHKVLPGFGEQMRQVSLKYVPTAILSRQVGVDPRPRADPQPARPAEGDQGNARRRLSRRALLHRPDRRPVHRDARRRLQGVPAEVGALPGRSDARSSRAARRTARRARASRASSRRPRRSARWRSSRASAYASGVDTPTLLALRFAIAAAAMLAVCVVAQDRRCRRGSDARRADAAGRARLRRPGVLVLHRAHARAGRARRAAPVSASGARRAARRRASCTSGSRR